MALTPLHDSIIFVFDDEVIGSEFNNVSPGGIIYKSYIMDASTSRWATVLSIGPKVTEVAVGDNILIENLQWTEGCKMPDGNKVWRTTEEKVMCVRQK